MCTVYSIYYIYSSSTRTSRVASPSHHGLDEQQNRRASLMNGKSRTRYSSKWQTQPPTATQPLLRLPRVCIWPSPPTSLWLHRRLFKHIPRTAKYIPPLSLYPWTAYGLSARSLGRRKSAAAWRWHRNFRRAYCTLRPTLHIYTYYI